MLRECLSSEINRSLVNHSFRYVRIRTPVGKRKMFAIAAQ
jgi:hypothetical protein